MLHTFGKGEVTTLFKVRKADGSERYFRVVGDKTEEIDEVTYKKEGGQ